MLYCMYSGIMLMSVRSVVFMLASYRNSVFLSISLSREFVRDNMFRWGTRCCRHLHHQVKYGAYDDSVFLFILFCDFKCLFFIKSVDF